VESLGPVGEGLDVEPESRFREVECLREGFGEASELVPRRFESGRAISARAKRDSSSSNAENSPASGPGVLLD
jgi:hypothetical protein